jgi:type IV secretory pathway VirB2 component (pilin)
MIIIGNFATAIVLANFVIKGFVHILDMKDWDEIKSLLLLLFLSLLMAAVLVNFIGMW